MARRRRPVISRAGAGLIVKSNQGFTLLELSLALFICAVSVSIALPACNRVLGAQELISTSELLVDHLRYAQQLGQTIDQFGWVKMAPFDPRYATYAATRWLDSDQFAPGVNYKDGYLQLETWSLMYDDDGDMQVGGAIRLVDGGMEQDIHLYIGSGLQAMGSVHS